MEYIELNTFNPGPYKSFVPEPTKETNTNLILGIVVLIWAIIQVVFLLLFVEHNLLLQYIWTLFKFLIVIRIIDSSISAGCFFRVDCKDLEPTHYES